MEGNLSTVLKTMNAYILWPGNFTPGNLSYRHTSTWGFPGGKAVRNSPANARDARDMGLIPGSGRFAGERNGNPVQYSCLGNPMDRGTRRATVHGVAKSRARLSDWALALAYWCMIEVTRAHSYPLQHCPQQQKTRKMPISRGGKPYGKTAKMQIWHMIHTAKSF